MNPFDCLEVGFGYIGLASLDYFEETDTDCIEAASFGCFESASGCIEAAPFDCFEEAASFDYFEEAASGCIGAASFNYFEKAASFGYTEEAASDYSKISLADLMSH